MIQTQRQTRKTELYFEAMIGFKIGHVFGFAKKRHLVFQNFEYYAFHQTHEKKRKLGPNRANACKMGPGISNFEKLAKN
jgi:hypothetical protein